MSSERQKLLGAARRLLASRADAEDAVQDTYVRALAAFPPGAAPEPAWMYAVLRNVAIDRLRRQRLESRNSPSDLPLEPSSEDLLGMRSECESALRQLFRRVRPAEAAALLLRDVFEFDYEEIARALGKSEPACRQFLSRARARVQRTDLGMESDEDYLGWCWRAVENRDPAPLISLLGRHGRTAGASVGATPRSVSRLVQVNGRYALALVLDGVVLCVVPLTPSYEAATSISM
jgi:RNA polymerase sigma factor (sigma-70 family)